MMRSLTAALLLSFGLTRAACFGQPQQERQISEKDDLAHRNHEIHWPAGKTPAEAQSFSHNEGYIDASCEKTFSFLARPQTWPTYLVFAKNVQLKGSGPIGMGSRFRWVIFGTPIESEIAEFVPSSRIAWTNLGSGFYQTWLLEPEGHGCRVTTEEAGFGPLAARITATGNTGTHRAHDLWLAALRWIVEPPQGQ